MRALLYDVHGNLPALEAVLADASDVNLFVLGGDYAVAGAWPRETVERLKELSNATWIRGNADRWLVDRHDTPSPIDDIAARCAEALGEELVQELAGLPESTTIDGTLYCHASPSSDMETFFPEPGERDAELLMGVEAKDATTEDHCQRLAGLAFDLASAAGFDAFTTRGIVLGKKSYLVKELGEATEVMRAIKRALDPTGVMNPGKVL